MALGAVRDLIATVPIPSGPSTATKYDEAQVRRNRTKLSAQIWLTAWPSQRLYQAGYSQDASKKWRSLHHQMRCEICHCPNRTSWGWITCLSHGQGEAVGEPRLRLDLSAGRGGKERANSAGDGRHLSVLVTIDFPDAITRGLRRTTDVTRSILEKTRGDLTMTLRQERLQMALRDFEMRMNKDDGNDG